MGNHRDKSLRDLARGVACTIKVPGVCNADQTTSVWCHSNSQADGKGMGVKADDDAGAIGCSACHDYVDGRRFYATDEERRRWFDRGRVLTAEVVRQARSKSS